jgi:DNA replication protein DnaC
MKLSGMLSSYESLLESKVASGLDNHEMLAHLLDAEWDARYNRKLERLLKKAKLRYNTSLEELKYKESRGLSKNAIAKFTDGTWIRKAESIIIAGSTGVGKSFLACALGNQACHQGYKVMYYSCLKLFHFLKMSKADGSYSKEINILKSQDLIILDDFAMEKMDSLSRLSLLEILEDRNGIRSTIITSQLPPNAWHEVIGEKTIADAVCDRIVHSANYIKLKGESLRKLKK